jgi:hypothetical protein
MEWLEARLNAFRKAGLQDSRSDRGLSLSDAPENNSRKKAVREDVRGFHVPNEYTPLAKRE